MFFERDTVNHFVLEKIEKIVRERWKIIENTTRYGWLITCCRGPWISREDSKILSNLANKIGYENCEEAFHQIRKASRHLHPDYVPTIAVAIFDEMYTIKILRKRGKECKWHSTSLKSLPPTVFTISNNIYGLTAIQINKFNCDRY